MLALNLMQKKTINEYEMENIIIEIFLMVYFPRKTSSKCLSNVLNPID